VLTLAAVEIIDKAIRMVGNVNRTPTRGVGRIELAVVENAREIIFSLKPELHRKPAGRWKYVSGATRKYMMAPATNWGREQSRL